MLTEKQYKLLVFINKVLKETGCSPSFDEMKEAVGLKSKSGIHALISALEEREFIRKLPHKARALEVIKMPKFKPKAILEEEKKREIALQILQSTLEGSAFAALPQTLQTKSDNDDNAFITMLVLTSLRHLVYIRKILKKLYDGCRIFVIMSRVLK